MYDQQHRQGATRGNYAKCELGESMKFRVMQVYPLSEVPAERAKFGAYDCAPHDIWVFWNLDASGHYTQPELGKETLRWEPAADKIDGLIKLSDRLGKLTGDPKEIMKHDVILKISEEKNPATSRWYHVYSFELDGPEPAQVAAAAQPPASRGPGGASPPAAGGPPASAAVLHDVRIALDRCVDLAQLEVEVRRLWPQILAVKATAEVTADVKARKFKMAKAAFMAAPTVDELNAQWSLSAPKFERVPDDFEALSVVYHQRHADIGNGVGPAIAAEDDIPF